MFFCLRTRATRPYGHAVLAALFIAALRWGGDLQGGAPYAAQDPQNPAHLIGFEVELADALAFGLQGLLKFQESYIYSTTPAQVIGSSGSMQNRLVWLDRGSADGIASKHCGLVRSTASQPRTTASTSWSR